MQREIEVIFKCSIHSSIDESSSEKLFFQKVLQKIDFFKGTGFPCTAPEIRVGKCLHATLNVTTYIGPLVGWSVSRSVTVKDSRFDATRRKSFLISYRTLLSIPGDFFQVGESIKTSNFN